MATVIRPLADGDPIAGLTALLNRAYAPLAARGLNFTAADQDEATTRERIGAGQCFVAVLDGRLVGAITATRPADAAAPGGRRLSPWQLRRDVVHLNQLAVEPALQRQGLGAALMDAAEAWAAAQGFAATVLDTAQPALELQQRYAARGYVEVGQVAWPGKSYRSVVMARPLPGRSMPSAQDGEHRRACVAALWAHVQARDWVAMREAFTDDAVMHWPVTGERFDGAARVVELNATYPEGWTLHFRDAEARADGRVHALVEVEQGGRRFFCNGLYRFDGERIVDAVEHWADAAPPPAWRAGLATRDEELTA